MPMELIDDECPKCGKINWVNNGDTSDLTVSDVEAIRCWSCRNEWFIGYDMPGMYGEDVKPCDVMIEDGKKSPGEAV
jgi:hypothetical protein|tara:strand:- start:2766 stop:2996 length:231 start_codon:yes stop_codon:yes gene_type:complete